MYSPGPMGRDEKRADLEEVERRVAELERLADSLGGVPDERLVEELDRAAGLLGEINAAVEAHLEAAGRESRELGFLLEGTGFGAFDEALAELESREREQDAGA